MNEKAQFVFETITPEFFQSETWRELKRLFAYNVETMKERAMSASVAKLEGPALDLLTKAWFYRQLPEEIEGIAKKEE